MKKIMLISLITLISFNNTFNDQPNNNISDKQNVFSVETLNQLVPIVNNTKNLVNTSIGLESWFKDTIISGNSGINMLVNQSKMVISGPDAKKIADLIRIITTLCSNLTTHLLGAYDSKTNSITLDDDHGVLSNSANTIKQMLSLISNLKIAQGKIATGALAANNKVGELQTQLNTVIKNATQVLEITNLVASLISPAEGSKTVPVVIKLESNDIKESVSAKELDDIMNELE